ncbi:MAG TPA: thiamine pyrophosphate-dependent enzyme [Micropepsaceae bacterium]|nr:thiamine pyrophosphate-dependent enzyme [Micropepsaceae bacterium]
MSKTIKRRQFLAGMAAAPAVGLAASATKAVAQTQVAAASSVPAVPMTDRPTNDMPPQTIGKTGSDFMVDVLKSLDIDYIASCPGSTFRGLHESIINYGENTKPEFITTLHEDTAAAMCHGYYKVAKKPMACMVHGTVGLQHASMAIYNAFADRVPMFVLTGNIGKQETRQAYIEWDHAAQDQGAMVRDITKWDDQPTSLQGFAESMVRGYDMMTTAPMAPVLIVADGDLQEDPIPAEVEKKLRIPKLKLRSQPAGEIAAVREAAKMLIAADNPVIYTNRYGRTENAPALLIQLAELIGAPVVDAHNRMNMPNRHPLNHSFRREAVLQNADVILALEPIDLFGLNNYVPDLVTRPNDARRRQANLKIIHIGTEGMMAKSNFQDFQRFAAADISIAGDAEATVPSLIEALKTQMSVADKGRCDGRCGKVKEASAKLLEQARAEVAYSWDTKPISSGRLVMELWDQIKNEDWMMPSETQFLVDWPYRLWDINKPYQTIGGSGAQGIGYNSPAALGAALANKDKGRLTVAIVGDGDFNMAPGVLWTAAHHKIPILYIVHNNRAYHQEVMMILRMAARRQRVQSKNVYVGTLIDNPAPDYAKIAQGYGLFAESPVADPKDLAGAIRRAMDVVKKGEPALIDVVSDGR